MDILIATIALLILTLFGNLSYWFFASVQGLYLKTFQIGVGPVIFKKEFAHSTFQVHLILPLGGSTTFQKKTDNGFEDEILHEKSVFFKALVFLPAPVLTFICGLVLLPSSVFLLQMMAVFALWFGASNLLYNSFQSFAPSKIFKKGMIFMGISALVVHLIFICYTLFNPHEAYLYILHMLG